MLYSIVVNFQAQADAVISPTQGYHAYALFLHMLRQVNASVAQKLHDLEGPKPFTLSPLQGKFRRYQSGIKLTADEIYWIRFTFLQEDIFAYFLDAALKAGDQTLPLDQALLQIHEIVTTPEVSPLCQCQDFNTILASVLPEHHIQFEFLSPTAFRSGGARNVLFPEPRLLFNSYFARWQSFSPIKLSDKSLALVEKVTRTAQYKLETRILHFGSYQEIGFEGTCAIEIAEEVPEETVKTFNALADFAFFCGTGAKTSMGMGQTRRVKDARSLPGRARSYSEKG